MKPKTPLAHAISLAIAAAALGGAGPVAAQEQDTATATASLEEIVVTGSRLRRDTYSAPQPMDVIAPEQAFVQGVGSVSALLQSGKNTPRRQTSCFLP